MFRIEIQGIGPVPKRKPIIVVSREQERNNKNSELYGYRIYYVIYLNVLKLYFDFWLMIVFLRDQSSQEKRECWQ
jgi:hypothetical protein